MHTLLDIRGAIPAFITVTTGKLHDVNVLDEVPLEPDSVVTMDRAYVDFARLHAIHRLAAFFVVRAKRNLRFRRIDSVPADGSTGVRADQTIVLAGTKSRQGYPEPLRRVSYVDQDKGKRLVFLTNHSAISAKTVADIYCHRWQVELFFKMDQAAPAYKGLLRNLAQCRQNPYLDRHQPLPAGRHRHEDPRTSGKPPHDPANP
jgi:hypothetical protein